MLQMKSLCCQVMCMSLTDIVVIRVMLWSLYLLFLSLLVLIHWLCWQLSVSCYNVERNVHVPQIFIHFEICVGI